MTIEIFLRIDASPEIGSGHLMRCLTLAEMFSEEGADVSFVCSQISDELANFVKSKKYNIYHLPCHNKGFDWQADAGDTIIILKQRNKKIGLLVVDHYALDQRWESEMRPYTENIMVIDDLANRHHDCDILLDQNYYKDANNRYDGLVPGDCQKFIGPEFALLRKEFFEVRKNLRQRDGIIKNIIISFGCSDFSNETAKALSAIKQLNRPDIAVNVIIGTLNISKTKILQVSAGMPGVNFYYQTDRIAQLMDEADLAIGAGGATAWERCFLGLPSIVITTAKNQVEIVKNLQGRAAIWSLGYKDNVSAEGIASALKNALNNPILVKKTGEAACKLMDSHYYGQRNFIDIIMQQKYSPQLTSREGLPKKKILFLYNHESNGLRATELMNWLKKIGEEVIPCKDRFDFKYLCEIKPDIIISYGCRYILQKNIINFPPLGSINLHISYLPFNRGADPNIWSFLENTPKGVTIHYIDENIDSGDIILQKEVFFNDNDETLETTYAKLQTTIISLFQENWHKIKTGQIKPRKQSGAGSIHHTKDQTKFKYLIAEDGWKTPIKNILLKKFSEAVKPGRKLNL